jgi:hypothetical protein
MGKQSQIGDALVAPIKSPSGFHGKLSVVQLLRARSWKRVEMALENIVIPVDHRDSSP